MGADLEIIINILDLVPKLILRNRKNWCLNTHPTKNNLLIILINILENLIVNYLNSQN